MISKHLLFGLAMALLSVLGLLTACTPIRKELPPGGSEVGCIEGTVWYRTAEESDAVPYPHANISAWRHGTDKPLGETKANEKGAYCIELPLGSFQVDLRVWGYARIQKKDLIFRGSRDGIDLGTNTNRCGGDCIKADIVADITDQIPQPRLRR
jgi:hypothetical protein